MEKTEGISLLQLFKVMFGKIWRLLIIAACICVAGTLAIEFGYNRAKNYYVANFAYGSKALNQNEYIDGSTFQYLSMISKENLVSIKESDEKFSSINIDALVKSNMISLVRESNSYTDNDGKTAFEYRYSIKTYKKFFSSNDQARDFIETIAYSPVLRNINIANNTAYASYLEQYKASNDISVKALCLQNEVKYIQSLYEELLELYGDVSFAIDNTNYTISTALESVKTFMKSSSVDSLIYEVDTNGFIYDDSIKAELESNRIALVGEKEYNNSIIGAINDSIASIVVAANNSLSDIQLAEMMETVNELSLRNGEIDYTISAIDKKLANIGNTDPEYIAKLNAFKAKMDNYEGSLEQFASRLSVANKQITEKYTTIGFNNTNIIEQKGGFAIYASILLTLVGGVVIGAIVNLIVDRKHLRDDIVEAKEK